MIVKRIEINNFRSYYKENIFDFTDGLNLIVGANGDGKTAFYEALEWLFITDGTRKSDDKDISKKRADELIGNESDVVKVSMTYEHKGCIKTLEKLFRFTKAYNTDEITTSGFEFTLYEQNDVERTPLNGIHFDSDLPVEIRKYIMFKGESDLDVFQRTNALKSLIETFSDVRDFETYFSFMEFATAKATQAKDNAQKADRKNADRIKYLQQKIEETNGILSEIEKELADKEATVNNCDDLLRNVEQNAEASEMLKTLNRRIETKTHQRDETQKQINEDYTIDLLDNKWILMGFEPIAHEFTETVSKFDKLKRKLEKEFLVTLGVNNAIKKMQQQPEFVPLPVHIPGPQIMKEMLDEEVCKICGRKAPKGSDAWNFMLHKLEEYKESLKVEIEEDPDSKSLYANKYIEELQKRDNTLMDNLDSVTRIRKTITETINKNNNLHLQVKQLDGELNKEFEYKKTLLAQTDGLSEDQLLSQYQNITNWYEQKRKAESRIDILKRNRESQRQFLEDAQNELSSLAIDTPAQSYTLTWQMLKNISEAFKNAKEENKKRLMSRIEDEANQFMSKLNSDDFTGTIRIKERANGQGEAILMNSDDTRIYRPNTALRTTYLMSVLFAIEKISSEKNETEFPLIFDAPTSSFTSAKEEEFFKVISSLNKQVIIVTKSFIQENGSLNNQKIQSINGHIFHIAKKRPFNDKNLATIQTIINRIK